MRAVLLDTCALIWLGFDPADRFIIATALENNLPVVTSDDKFEKYGVKTIR